MIEAQRIALKDAKAMPREDGPHLDVSSGKIANTASSAHQVLQTRGYKVHRKLGQGGMGRVYEATQLKLGRKVAIKVLRRTDDNQAIVRFEREMMAVGRLNHPNIVQAYDAGEIGGLPYLVMENVDGLSLADVLARCGPLPVPDACELVRQAAIGLQYAYENGFIHRDLKPSNLMLSRQGQVKILDLGLARCLDDERGQQELTSVGATMGTADYMAPEQAADSRNADIRADLYSLGCTLYALLAGQPPFSGPGLSGVVQKRVAHARNPVPPLANRRSDVPPELVAVLDRLLAKESEARFATPAELTAALEKFTPGSNLRLLAATAAGREAAPAVRGLEGTPPVAASPLADTPQPAAPPLPPRTFWKKPKFLWITLTALCMSAVGIGLILTMGGPASSDVPGQSEDVVAPSPPIEKRSVTEEKGVAGKLKPPFLIGWTEAWENLLQGDIDHDGTLSLEEFITYPPRMSSTASEHRRKLFRVHDANQDDKVERDEFHHGREKLGIALKRFQEEVNQRFAIWDTNGDGKIANTEFLRMKKGAVDPVAVFLLLDTDKDGAVDRDELFDLGARMIELWDTDGDGQVSLQDIRTNPLSGGDKSKLNHTIEVCGKRDLDRNRRLTIDEMWQALAEIGD